MSAPMLTDSETTTATARAHRWWAYTPIWVLFVIGARWALQVRGVVVNLYVHDLFVVIDTAWRAYLGQRPNVDYVTPVGPAFAWPWLVLKQIEPFSLTTIVHAEWLVASCLLVCASVTLPRRLGPVSFFAVGLALVTAAVTPRAMLGQVEGLRPYFDGAKIVWHSVRAEDLYSYRADFISHLAPYNRWSQAALVLLVPVVLVAPRRQRVGCVDVAAGLVIGLVMAFLALTKVTYAIAGVPLIGLGLWQRQVGWRTIGLATITGLGVAGLEQITGHDLLRYWADLRMAAAATVDFYGYNTSANYQDYGLKNLHEGLFLFEIYGFALVIVALGCAGGEPWRAALWRQRQGLLLGLAACALVLVLNTQNFTQHEFPALGPILVLSVTWFARTPGMRPATGGRRIAMVIALAVGVLTVPLLDAQSIVRETWLADRGLACALPQWRGTPGAGLLMPASAFDKHRDDDQACAGLAAAPPATLDLFDKESFQIAKLDEARGLLAGYLRPDIRILALDFSNPYPAFTGTPAPRGALLWWDPGRDYSAHVKPDAAVMLGDTTLVLQPRLLQPRFELGYDPLWQAYGKEVEAHFTPVGQTRLWRLWQRRDLAAAR